MKMRHWVVAGLGMAAGVALVAASVQAADDETSYRFRLASNHVQGAAYIRCGTSGDWTRAAIGWSIDVTCGQPDVQTKIENGNAFSHTHNCSSRPVMRIEHKGLLRRVESQGEPDRRMPVVVARRPGEPSRTAAIRPRIRGRRAGT